MPNKPQTHTWFADESAQATLEWTLLIFPIVFLLMVPIEWGMRYRARLVALGSVHYAVWNNAGKSGSTADRSTMDKIIQKNLKAVKATTPSGNVEVEDSFDTIGGTMGAVAGDTLHYAVYWPSSFLRERFESYYKGEIKVKYDSPVGKLLAGFYKRMTRKSLDGDTEITGFEVEMSDYLANDPWIPVQEAPYFEMGSFAMTSFFDAIVASWAIDLFSQIAEIKSIYYQIVSTMSTVYQMIDNLVDITCTFDFGAPWFMDSAMGYGCPWGRIETYKDIQPRESNSTF